MTTPAQYEAAIRWLEEVVAELDPNTRRRDAAPHLEPRTTHEYRALHSAAAALAIVREAREDAARLDCLERAANEPDGLHLHDGTHRGCCGLGLARLDRTLREAVDQSLRPSVPDAR